MQDSPVWKDSVITITVKRNYVFKKKKEKEVTSLFTDDFSYDLRTEKLQMSLTRGANGSLSCPMGVSGTPPFFLLQEL